MIKRAAQTRILQLLNQFPAVGILGPRQVGKTTLALEIAQTLHPNPTYLDLERPSDLAKLIGEPELYLQIQAGHLVILDEIQRLPGLFMILRSTIDLRRQAGEKAGQFLLLGSASLDLLHQSAESLAGRIAYQELSGFTIDEITAANYKVSQLWLRGSFPDSFLAISDEASLEWRRAFIRTYLERDVPQFGPRIPAETLRRFWTMLAHNQGAMLNGSRLAASLGVSTTTVNRYLDLLVDLLLVRTLRPWSGNVGKRLIKSPKVYIRDSGIVHALLDIRTHDDLLGHPVVGGSWEGFVIENLLSQLPDSIPSAWFYRTASGAEIDLLIEMGKNRRIAIEIKHSLMPTISKGFYLGCEDVQATEKYVVFPGKERFQITPEVTAISVIELMQRLKN